MRKLQVAVNMCTCVCVCVRAATHYQRLIAVAAKSVRRNVRRSVVLGGESELGGGRVFCVVCGYIQLTNAISHVDEWIST